MLRYGGATRTNEFKAAYQRMRTGGSMSGSDAILAAGFTEVMNASKNTRLHLNEITQSLVKYPKLHRMGQLRFTPAGVDPQNKVTEYIAVAVASYVKVYRWGYCHLYKSTNIFKNNLAKFFAYAYGGTDVVLPTPAPEQEGGAWKLVTSYRGIAFVAGLYEERPFIIGFMHNVCQIGDPGVCVKAMPQAFTAIRDLISKSQKPFASAPIVIGGDFNVRPYEPRYASFTRVLPRGAYEGNSYVKTTSCEPLDFWFYNDVPFQIGEKISPGNQNCLIHPEAFNQLYALTRRVRDLRLDTRQITDHMGISMMVG